MNIEELKRKYTPQSWENDVKKRDYWGWLINETIEKLEGLLIGGD